MWGCEEISLCSVALWQKQSNSIFFKFIKSSLNVPPFTLTPHTHWQQVNSSGTGTASQQQVSKPAPQRANNEKQTQPQQLRESKRALGSEHPAHCGVTSTMSGLDSLCLTVFCVSVVLSSFEWHLKRLNVNVFHAMRRQTRAPISCFLCAINTANVKMWWCDICWLMFRVQR